MKLVMLTLVKMMCASPVEGKASKLYLDLGYNYDEVRRIVQIAGFEPVVMSRRDEKQSSKQRKGQARRWVVERTHSWMNRFRRLLVRWEKREDTYLAMLHFACGIITWRAALTK
jgi:putative transposase